MNTAVRPREEPSQIDELKGLYGLTDNLYRAQSLDDVYAAALDAITATLRCNRASILLFDKDAVMRFVAWRGLSDGYRTAVDGHTPWTLGQTEATAIFVSDIETTEEPESLKETIKKENIRGLGFIPLVSQGGVIGKFMTYYETPHAFTPQEQNLAVTIARQVGFSVERARAATARQAAEQKLRESEERFRLMTEHAPVMIWVSDAKGACLHLNHMLRDFWGVGEDAVASFDWRTTIHEEDCEPVMAATIDAVTMRTGVKTKGRYRHADGRYRILQTDARPRFDQNGEFLGMIGINVDVTDRDEAENALRKSEERFRLAVEAAPSAMVMTDRDANIVLVNANTEKLFGYKRSELNGKKLDLLIPQWSDHKRSQLSPDNGSSSGARGVLFGLSKDGHKIPVEVGFNPIEGSDGTMEIASIVDISERQMAERQRELLLAELNHRVKNTLAVVQGIAHQTFKGTDEKARKAFEGRLVALSTAHNLLTRANWENASLDQLAADSLQTAAAQSNRILKSGPHVLLPPRQALAIALALHELFTNAVKYGALSNDTGIVELTWAFDGDDKKHMRLEWRERGGPPVEKPVRRGFGSILLEQTLAIDLNGDVKTEYGPQGLICIINFEL